jgi:hypothetical protein
LRKTGSSKVQEQTGQRLWYRPLKEFGREALRDTVVLFGWLSLKKSWKLNALRCAVRITSMCRARGDACGTCGEFANPVGGRLAEVRRPRVRSTAHELSLPSWQTWTSRDTSRHGPSNRWCWAYRAGAMRARWSPRRKELRVHGVSKSAVSKRFVVGAARKLCRADGAQAGGLKSRSSVAEDAAG